MKRSLNSGLTVDSKRTKSNPSQEAEQIPPTSDLNLQNSDTSAAETQQQATCELAGKYMINLHTKRLEIKSKIDALDYSTTDLIKPIIPPAPLKARIVELISKVTSNGPIGLKKIPLIHEAIRYGYDDVALFLMESGDECTFKADRNGQNILHVSVANNKESIVKKILNWNRDILRDLLTERDKEGFTPIDIAIKNGNVGLFNLLSAHHAKLGVYTNNKHLILLATQYGHAKFLPFWLQSIHPDDYKTLQLALCIAIFNDRADCAQIIIEQAKKSGHDMKQFVHDSIRERSYLAKDFIPYDQTLKPSISPDMMWHIIPNYTGNELILEYALNYLKYGTFTPAEEKEEKTNRAVRFFSGLIQKFRNDLSYAGLIEILNALHTHKNAGPPLMQLIDNSISEPSLAYTAGFARHKDIATHIVAAYKKHDLDILRHIEQIINEDEKALDYNFSGKSELRKHIQKTVKCNLNKTIEELISELDNQRDLHKVAQEIERKYEESRTTGNTSDLLCLLKSVQATHEKSLPAIDAMTLEFCGSTVEALSQHCSENKEKVIILETPRRKIIEDNPAPTRSIPLSF